MNRAEAPSRGTSRSSSVTAEESVQSARSWVRLSPSIRKRPASISRVTVPPAVAASTSTSEVTARKVLRVTKLSTLWSAG